MNILITILLVIASIIALLGFTPLGLSSFFGHFVLVQHRVYYMLR